MAPGRGRRRGRPLHHPGRGLLFPESPRWHDGRLWLSEKRAGRVLAVSPHAPADVETIAHVDGEPGGLGWRPDGTLPRGVDAHAQRGRGRRRRRHLDRRRPLRTLTTGRCNDMVVDGTGAAYVGDFGYDLAAGAAPRPGVLVLVPVDGAPTVVVADDLHFPNGCVVTPDGTTLVAAESAANRLTAFDMAADGSLTGRRVFADLGDVVPDGIALDADGAVWVADPLATPSCASPTGARCSNGSPPRPGRLRLRARRPRRAHAVRLHVRRRGVGLADAHRGRPRRGHHGRRPGPRLTELARHAIDRTVMLAPIGCGAQVMRR